MTAKQALKACEKISSSHGFICTEKQHLCLHGDGHHSYTSEFSICVFKHGELLERFSSIAGFRDLLPQIKALTSKQP